MIRSKLLTLVAVCVSKGLHIGLHLLIRYLNKMVEAELIIKNMALLQRKDGSYGKREVAVYSKNTKNKKIKK